MNVKAVHSILPVTANIAAFTFKKKKAVWLPRLTFIIVYSEKL